MVEFIKEFFSFLRGRKKLWVAPLVIVMLVIAALLIVAQGSIVAPFIYALF